MTSPASNSAPEASNLTRLDERIQRWVWQKGWTGLRDAQEAAIPILLQAAQDLIITAATASGKTEAAFLPILSKLLGSGEEMGVALYISPLKALINDQWSRLDQLCEELSIPVVPWHGDIGVSRKRAFMRRPQGVLLITPESLEAQFVHRGHEISRLFGELQYVVVDELHAFIGSDRGKQLQSLIRRIECVIDRRVPRVGLSATLGDPTLAAKFLRPEGPVATIIQSRSTAQELLVQLRGYLNEPMGEIEPADQKAYESMADHLYKVLRGANNLLFPNSRSRVEYFSDLLRRRCERDGVPNEFWPHHGSLSREIREETEAALKAGNRPATAICTNTLELGIDIGAVKSVAQIGPPPSVASLRQRLGRSGRRSGEPAILRSYAMENTLTAESPISDRLRESLVHSAACIRLLLGNWFEPPREGGLHLSTLVQQVLSMAAERGGVMATDVASTLIRNGPFAALSPSDLGTLLRELGRREMLIQDTSGALLLGPLGERLVGHHDFYAAFAAREEWQIVEAGHTLGTLPIDSPVFEGLCLIFGGRRWKILSVSTEPAVLTVTPDPTGIPPRFDSGRPLAHERIRHEMRNILEEETELSFLDVCARRLLHEARKFYRDARLSEHMVLRDNEALLILPWSGDLAQNTLVLLLRSLGLESGSNDGLVVRCEGWDWDRLTDACSDIVNLTEVDLVDLLKTVENLGQSKWDWALPRELLVRSFASTHLDIAGAKSIAARLLSAVPAHRSPRC